jgi:hypothetical protein
MKRKVSTIFLSLLAFFFFANVAHAQIIINEVQTAPIGERFIELYNAGGSDIDLTGWYIQRKTATGSKFGSLVTSTKFENKSIKAGGYFLISRTTLSGTDIVVANMTLTDSNTIRLRDSKGKDVDQVVLGSLVEGESYQKTQNGWVSATPTPGTPNLAVQPPSDGSSGSGSSDTITETNTQEQPQPPVASSGNAISWPVEPQIFARIKDAPKIAIVGADVLFEGEALGLEKKPLSGARYLWVFGDGGTKEGEKVLYYYNYPGKYVVILNASSGKYSASDRIIIEAIPADLQISSVGTGNGSFVEVQNNTKYELNLSRWMLRAGTQLFTIPKDTIILPGSKIIFPSRNTKFDITKNENVDLLYPNGTIATSYTWTLTPPVHVKAQTPKAHVSAPVKISTPPKPVKDRPLQTRSTDDRGEELPIGSVVSEQQSANIFTATKDTENSIYKWLFAVAALAVISVLGVLFTGKMELATERISKEADSSRSSSTEAEEYEIIEDED